TLFRSARPLLPLLPPIAEARFRNGVEVAELRPSAGHAGQVGELAFAFKQKLAGPRELLRGFVTAVAEKDFRGELHRDVFCGELAGEGLLVFADNAAAQMDQSLGDVDLDRADFVARSAKRRRVRQRTRVLKVLQLRRENRTNRAGVDGTIRQAAGLPIDGAGVEAGPAADAGQRFPLALVQ